VVERRNDFASKFEWEDKTAQNVIERGFQKLSIKLAAGLPENLFFALSGQMG